MSEIPAEMIEAARLAGRLAARDWTESRGLFAEFLDDRLVHAITDASLAAALRAGETRTEWGYRYRRQSANWTRTVVCRDRADAETSAYEFRAAFSGTPGAEAQVLTRITHTSPWVEVPDA